MIIAIIMVVGFGAPFQIRPPLSVFKASRGEQISNDVKPLFNPLANSAAYIIASAKSRKGAAFRSKISFRLRPAAAIDGKMVDLCAEVKILCLKRRCAWQR
jgi:hypothetical protein